MREEKRREVPAKRGPVLALAAFCAHGAGPEPSSLGSLLSIRSRFPTLSSLPVAGVVWSGWGAALSPSRGGSSVRRGRLGAGGREEELEAIPLPCAAVLTPALGSARFEAAPAHPGGSARGAEFLDVRDRGGREKSATAARSEDVLWT